MALAELSEEVLSAVEQELRSAVGGGPPALADYYAMLEYHLGWTDGQGAGGKRIRPLLCLLCCAGAGGDWRTALPIAAAIELLHNFSLMHDDIQDNSPLRRGRPTVWARWGAPQAINAGDAMFTLAHLAALNLSRRAVPSETVVAALLEFDHTCLRLTQGQYLDMRFEARQRVTVSEYLEMIEGKTAALIAASARLGALIAGAAVPRLDHFTSFGRHLGLAFQVQDDLLGIWGDPAVTGKSAASDLERRKKSLPAVFGLERSEPFARAYAQPHQGGDSVAEMTATLERLGAREHAATMADELTRQAMADLESAEPAGAAGAALHELTLQLLRRDQ